MNKSEVPTIPDELDIVICGGGLAGLTLARQIKRDSPDLSVLVLERTERPLPPATYKVGESLVESGSYYLSGILGLEEYLEQNHLRKCGFRFFFNTPGAEFKDRPEFGLSKFPRAVSYQIDRGILESDLRDFNERDGVLFLEGVRVKDIVLGQNGDCHKVILSENGKYGRNSFKTRWVVDAMGRRRFLQKKLELTKEHGRKCSAAWFRLDGRIDVDDLVPREEIDWHNRVPDENRYYSTNHLMGPGYWVWLIPLSSNTTSVGIVALDEMHPHDQFNTYERAMNWLRTNEPDFANLIAGREPMDFLVMKDYSYSSRRIFSDQRWACVGEASLFPDPFYALASDLIGFENTAITEMIRLDQENRLSGKIVDRYNQFILSINHWVTSNIQLGYPYFGNSVIMACKVLWDTAMGWTNLGPQMFNQIFLDEEAEIAYKKVTGKYFFLTRVMQHLFIDWSSKPPGRFSYDFIDFLSLPFMLDLQRRNLRPRESVVEMIDEYQKNMDVLEELAQTIFLIAVEDVMQEAYDRFEPPVWLNAWSLTLDEGKWEHNSLFEPFTEPRDLGRIWTQLRGAFKIA